ncbi:ras-associated and pleckstrin homology domains-containing protein 1-like [Mytilus californianus]|uniref:ras-associated and pleckstrin homology domains-containing protein 1-like n=1 Tax=Mytilus californianus TaxID=6549 RepID=UPI002246E0E8|nr:ras-associated and pleckstrin homology domains-containing protein 1-like [Mytilus californianus]
MPRSEETNVKSVTRNSYRDRKPIGYVTIEQAVDEKTFQRLTYIDSRQEYVVQRHSPRNVGCQMNTNYEILLSRRTSPPTPTPPPSPPPPQPSPPAQCDVGCQMTTNYVILLSKRIPPPPPPPPLPPPPPPPPPPPTPPPTKKGQLVYCIDLRPPTEIFEPKPFEIDPPILPKQKVKKKKIDDYIVTVGGGWNKMNDYMERHEPVKRFVYEREQLKNSDLPEKKKKYYGFKSIYKSPGYRKAHRIL